jgi:hypothetical protein
MASTGVGAVGVVGAVGTVGAVGLADSEIYKTLYKFQQPGYYVPEPKPGPDGKRLVGHWGSDEASALRERLREAHANILDRAQKLAKLKDLIDAESMDIYGELYAVAEELVDNIAACDTIVRLCHTPFMQACI